MSEITTSRPHTTQAGVSGQARQVPEQRAETSYSTPEVGYAPAPTDPLLSPSSIANTSDEPPPYSGVVINKG